MTIAVLVVVDRLDVAEDAELLEDDEDDDDVVLHACEY